MRKNGVTLAVIAEQVGYNDPSMAQKAIKRAMSRIPEQSAEELRLMMTEQLNDLYRRTAEVLTRSHPVLYKGVPVEVTLPDGSRRLLEDDTIRLAAVNTFLRVQERMAKLHGLDLARAEVPEGEVQPLEVVATEVVTKLRLWREQHELGTGQQGAVG